MECPGFPWAAGIWCYEIGGRSKHRWARKHDVILFYSKSPTFHFDPQGIAGTRKAGTHMKTNVDAEGREYQEKRDGKTGKVYRYYIDEGTIPTDWWVVRKQLNREAAERLGYPTQKPLALLNRIVSASSRPGDVVLDPFCGCGTTIAAAQALNRRWIGIDITHLAISLIKNRLADTFGAEVAKAYRVIGEPTDVEGARELAADDPFQFQAWALGLVEARVAGSDRRGGDKGIDGRLYFHEGRGDSKQVIFSVKAGKLAPTYVRDLRGVVEREGAEIGVLISFEPSTPGMRAEAASAGFYDSPDWGRFPRLQLLTVAELLEGKGIEYPKTRGGNVTFRRARRAYAPAPENLDLFGKVAESSPDEAYDAPDSN